MEESVELKIEGRELKEEKCISVVMATYNGEKYIKEQVESVLRQTYQNFELIVSDDCSTDATVQVLLEMARSDSRIKVHVNTENMGFKRNFQHAIELCPDTEFYALCDQDDVWTPDHLEHLISIIGNKPLACANSTLVDSNLKSLGMTLAEQQSFSHVAEDDAMKAVTILLWRNPYQGSTMLVRRSLIEKALPFPDGVNFHDSWLAILSCFCGGLAYSMHPISMYRMHGDNASGSKLKKMSRRGAFTSRVLGLKSNDRVPMINAVEERASALCQKDRNFLQRMRQYFIKEGFLQRLSNALYLTLHFKSIFTL